MIDRMKRVEQAIKRELTYILHDDISNPHLSNIMITKVSVAKDLRTAKVFYIFFPDDSFDEKAQRSLKSAGGYIRHELAKKVKIKYIPRLSFFYDDEKKETEEIDLLFKKIEAELPEEDLNTGEIYE